MMIKMVDRPNTTPIGQDKKTLTFKVLLYLLRQDHGFDPLCGSQQLPVSFLKTSFGVIIGFIYREKKKLTVVIARNLGQDGSQACAIRSKWR